jgi:hypothetical protein
MGKDVTPGTGETTSLMENMIGEEGEGIETESTRIDAPLDLHEKGQTVTAAMIHSPTN